MKTGLAHLLASLDPATLFGLAGLAIGSVWALFESRRLILGLQATGALAFAAHFALLGATTGAATCALAAAQALAAQRLQGRALVVAYASSAVLLVGALAKTWQGLPSFFAALGAGFATAGRLQAEPQRMRWLFLGGTAAWVAHNILIESALGLAADALSLAVLAIGLLRAGRPASAA